MPKILTTNADIQCPHEGKGESIPVGMPLTFITQPPNPKGGAVLLDGDTGVITRCGNLPYLCVSYNLMSMQLNSVKSGGRNVMLVTDFVVSQFGFPLTMQESHSVNDNTTPFPLPAGGAQEIPPELREDDQPRVTVQPSTLTMSQQATGSTAVFNFRLESDFPNKFNAVDNNNGDVTMGSDKITVTPPGGVWASSPLTVTMTISYLYAASVEPGSHGFFVTAVNQRGLFAMGEATLIVTP